VGQARTRLVNKVRHLLRRHNLQWQMPTKRFPTKAAVDWLKQLVLPTTDRLEMNHLLTDVEQVQQRMKELEQVIAQRCGELFTFLRLPEIDATSWRAELAIPFGVILSKVWGVNRTCGGARAQAADS
jgi:hypothetical protein